MRLSRLFPKGRRPPALAALPIVVVINAALALLAPFGAAEDPLVRVGVLLAVTGVLEVLHGVRRAESEALYRGVKSGATTVLMGLLIVSTPFLVGTALLLLLALSFAMDGLGYMRTAWRSEGRARAFAALGAAGDLGAAVLLLLTGQLSLTWVVSLAAALRMAGIAWTMAVTPALAPEDAKNTVLDDLGLADRPGAAALAARVAEEEVARVPSDRRWTIAFLVSLFAIHAARIQEDGTLLGLASPAIAVVGDMSLAILFTLVVIVPVVLSARSSTRWLERLVWQWYLAADNAATGWRHRLAALWLRYRLRIGMRLREAQYSVPAALWRSLATGLPVAAIIAATVPVWGMSWFFDTENWASGIWNSWAEARTDGWREAMGRAVMRGAGAESTTFAVAPRDIQGVDFSFIVIGDTGEGDASQHALRDQLLSAAARDEVRFVVISSDVVYPNGAMKDYEAKFWLPFKGVSKPVYAIPGNHDWYDALEGFLATFLEPEAARLSMRARAEADLRLTSTTEERIDSLIGEAQRLRGEYQVPTGFQRAPFFEVQADRFALVAIDTGVIKRIDDAQRAWLESALDRARGKTIMAVLGHPFYAGGQDQASGLRGLLQSQATPPRPRRHDLDGWRHTRPGVLRRAARSRYAGSALLRQRRRRRVPQLRHIAAMARQAANRRLGVLPQSRGRRRQARISNAVVQAARLVVDEQLQRLAVLLRVALGPVRLQRRAVLSELHRGARRGLGGENCARAVRRARAIAVERPGALPKPAWSGRRNGLCRMDCADAHDSLNQLVTALSHGSRLSRAR